jgi:hypothetical protein
MLGTTQIPARIPRTEQIIVPVQDTTLITLPRIPSKQIPGTPNVDRPWTEIPIPRSNIPETIRRPPTDIGTPFIPGLPIFPGAYGATGTKRRGRQFRELFPLGLDISSQTAFGSTKRPHAKRKKGKLIAKRLGK